MADNKASKPKSMTKSAVLQELAENTSLTRKQVSEVFGALSNVIKRELGKKGPGVFAIPGLIKLTVKRKEAVKAHKGIHPITKEPHMFKAKPAHNVVRARALKALKDLVN
jgi:nucleoid DNA-binding protein